LFRHFINWTLTQPDTSSTGHFINWTLHQLDTYLIDCSFHWLDT